MWFEPFDSIELRYGCTKSGVSVSKQQGNESMKTCRMGARGGVPDKVLHHVKKGPTNHERNLLHFCSLYIPTLNNITQTFAGVGLMLLEGLDDYCIALGLAHGEPHRIVFNPRNLLPAWLWKEKLAE